MRVKNAFRGVFRHFRDRGVAKRRQSLVAAFAVLALCGGCAGVGGLTAGSSPEVKREAVAKRAEARWDRLIKLDLDGAYAFLSPASKATMPLDLYKAKHKLGLYRAAKVKDVKCDGDACTVELDITYDFKKFKRVTTLLTEKWVISQGQAWFVDNG
jgi:hypothetical protein